MISATFHKGKWVKIVQHEEEIFYFIYNKDLDNAVISSEIIYKHWSIVERY